MFSIYSFIHLEKESEMIRNMIKTFYVMLKLGLILFKRLENIFLRKTWNQFVNSLVTALWDRQSVILGVNPSVSREKFLHS